MVKRATYVNADDDDPPARATRNSQIDPLVQALLGHLPPAHSVWPPPERAAWLKLLGDALGVIYRDAEPPKPAVPPHAQAPKP